MKKRFLGHGLASNPSGFTLLELLISLTIMGVILVIIFGSLRIGARAWEKGEADVEAQQREKVVFDLVKGQIASICAREIAHEDEDAYLFKGDERSVEFMSRLPAVPTTRTGMVYVKYGINEVGENGKELVFHEQEVVFMGREDISNEPDFDVLIPEAHHIGFDYLKQPETQGFSPDWQRTWDPESDEGIPMAVRMTFQRGKDTIPLRVIARIHPEEAR